MSSYAVVWREDEGPASPGKLEVESCAPCLDGIDGTQELPRAAQERLGRIGRVLNPAGYVKLAPIEELSLADWERRQRSWAAQTWPRTRPRRAASWRSCQLAVDAGREIRVNVLAPGSVRTPLTAPGFGEAGSGAHSAPPQSIQNRTAEPEEIAPAARFLLSDEWSFFTASILVADGGATAI